MRGEAIAQTQRENFINALSGRVAGIDNKTLNTGVLAFDAPGLLPP